MHWLPHLATSTVLVFLVSTAADAQTSHRKATSLVIVTGGQATLPIPTLMEGSENSAGNLDVADQLFLRLAELGPNLVTSGESDFTPALAKSWTRRDSTTLAFD
ncbi:MAG TPA: hypothetical protein VJ808_14600, partial [Gemmatimonadales bacterium]|nr:hypothetical protein [Gemmatimonadales bacterium]